MENNRITFWWKVVFRWMWLAVRFKSLYFNSLDTDQRLLFKGSGCRLIWDIQGAYIVKVYLNGKKVGACLPNECPVVDVPFTAKLEVKAFGLLRQVRQSLILTVKELKYKEAGRAVLAERHSWNPPVVRILSVRLKYQQPVSPKPLIRLDEISLDTRHMRQLEEALHERIIKYQIIAEKPKLNLYGNQLL